MTGTGFGNITVNGAGSGARDVMWGPIPQLLKFQHLGERAFECTFTVSWSAPTCADAVYEGQPLEVAYRLEFEPDRSGYTTRRYVGFLRIPLTRQSASSRRLTDSADSWRERINPALLPGFRRTYGPFVLNEAKTRLDWSIVDE